MAALGITLTGLEVARIVRRELLVRGRRRLRPRRVPWRRAARDLFGPRHRRRGPLQECGALCQDSLESVDVVLHALAAVWSRELDSGKGAAVRAEVPARDQVARGRLVVDLGGRGEGQVKLGREVKVQVEVFLGRSRLRGDGGAVGEGRRGWDHQQGECLAPGRGERLLLAIGEMISGDAVDGVQQLWVLAHMISHGAITSSLCPRSAPTFCPEAMVEMCSRACVWKVDSAARGYFESSRCVY